MTRLPQSPAEMRGIRLQGGRRAVILFSKLLGLRPELPFRIQQAHWNASRFELAVRRGDTGAEVTVVVEQPEPNPENAPFVASAGLSIWYQRGELAPELADCMRRGLSRNPGVTLAKLAELFLRDPELVTPAVSLDAAGAGVKRVREKVGVWNPRADYADFFAIDEFDLFPTESIELDAGNRFVKIQHTDLECHSFSPPQEKRSNMNLVSYPWHDPSRTYAFDDHEEISLSTDLSEYDVISGSLGKVRSVLEAAMREHPGRTIIFGNNCLPATTGEDVVSLVKRAQAESHAPILFYNRAQEESGTDMFKDLLRQRGPVAPRAALDPKRVNVVGLSLDPGSEELGAALEALGVSVGEWLLPSVGPEALERFPRAALDVVCRTSKSWDRLVRQLLANPDLTGGRQHIFTIAPYGMRHTRRWFEQIVDALGIDADVASLFATRFAAQSDRFLAMVERAQRLRVGLVVRSHDLTYLEDPAYTAGVPLVDVLEEMGFGIDVLVEATPSQATELVNRTRALFEERERHSFSSFHGFAELRRALAASPAHAVFSNHVFDWRLSEAGKSRFSIQNFHKGPSGAVRTLGELIAACEMPFFSRYRSYLERSPMGLRP